MAPALQADITVDADALEDGFTLGLDEDLSLFNERAGGAIIYETTDDLVQDYGTVGGFTSIPDASRRILSGASAYAELTTQGPAMFSGNSVVLARKWYVDIDVAAYRRRGYTDRMMNNLVGRWWGAKYFSDITDAAIPAVVAALVNNTAGGAVYDISTGATLAGGLDHKVLKRALSRFNKPFRIKTLVGDNQADIQLFDEAHDMAITNVTDAVIYGGSVPTQGRPLFVKNVSALENAAATPDEHYMLLLAEGAVRVRELARTRIYKVSTLDRENFIARWHFQWDLELAIKGYSWDTTNGGANPLAAALATGTNWDAISGIDIEDTAGMVIIFDEV